MVGLVRPGMFETRKDHDIVYVKLFGDVVLESDEWCFVQLIRMLKFFVLCPRCATNRLSKNGVINSFVFGDVQIPENGSPYS